jgi:N6-adenosine-specific RNA methylase IME4
VTTSNPAARLADFQFHPLANLFPQLEGSEFDDLVADVRLHGVREPIWLYQDTILDGRNRYRAAQTVGLDCPTRSYAGNDPVGFVISLNLRRRHLSESQRAMVAAKLATLKDGQRADLVEGLPIGRASELLSVGERTIARAREVREHGAPELQRAVERGDISVSAAADIAKQPLDEQRQIVARGEQEILRAAKEIRAKRIAQRRAEWTARTIELSKRNAPLPRDRRYPIALVDAPWPWEAYDLASGMERAVEVHYPTMSVKDICALPVGELATADAALFLWTTAPHLQDAFSVIEAWGFSYITNIVWVKDSLGLGYWVRNQHEHLLIAKRGAMRCPPEGLRPPSVIHAPRREHSRKPDEAYDLIERMYPDLPKIELFARARRPGWEAWGNEAPPPASEMPDIPDFLRRAVS